MATEPQDAEYWKKKIAALETFLCWVQTGQYKFSGYDLWVDNTLNILRQVRPVAQVDYKGRAVPIGLIPDSAGDLHQQVTTGGAQKASIVDLATGSTDYGLNIFSQVQLGQYAGQNLLATVGAIAGSAVLPYHKRRVGFVQSTLTSGAINDVELIPALAGYYGVVRVLGFVSDTADTYSLTFQDEDDAACVGSIDGRIDVVIATPYVPVKIGPQSSGVVVWNTNDNKAKEYDVAGGAGVEKVGIIYEWWYET